MSNPLHVNVPDGVPFIDYEREFDYPVSEIFRAHQDPALVAQWLGPRGVSIDLDHYDFRSGGSYRYTHSDDSGSYTFSGVFHTVRENEFAIQTFEFDQFRDIVSIEFMTFEDLGDGRSKLSGHSVFPSLEARDGMASSGWEEGTSDCYERIEELLSKATA
ncbi:SRPBCC family protein [Rhodococcus sp. NPDC058639]|uniref:SRPBCC family protein n=1 Tax=unclassified Rhodococcus (in: high G+C Gram-positive bacteria) TaxID=192944 RepID=UPI003653195F